jgi:hypothetical protein
VALSFGPPEIFALMLLAFATFVGLGGDDIPKTVFSICFGLVLGAIGFDQISGAPRLVLFDITGFLQGIGFLVLAIGVYGIGEMLWTIEQSRGEVDHDDAEDDDEGHGRRHGRGHAARLEGHGNRLGPGLFRRHPACGGGDARLADVLRRGQDGLPRPQEFGKRQSRWRRRAGGGQQLRLDGVDAADADARHSPARPPRRSCWAAW